MQPCAPNRHRHDAPLRVRCGGILGAPHPHPQAFSSSHFGIFPLSQDQVFPYPRRTPHDGSASPAWRECRVPPQVAWSKISLSGPARGNLRAPARGRVALRRARRLHQANVRNAARRRARQGSCGVSISGHGRAEFEAQPPDGGLTWACGPGNSSRKADPPKDSRP